MIKSEVIKQGAQLIANDFGLEPFDLNSLSEKDLLDTLKKVVQHFLDRDFNQLLNILYRIDIAEDEVKIILTTAPPDELSTHLAVKILERECRKAETRLRYRP